MRPTTKAKNIKNLPLDWDVKELIQSLPRHITSPFVFQRKGLPYKEAYARRLWKRYVKKQGVNVSLYEGTRSSSATDAADRVGIDATQEFLHHTSRKMTERYAHKNPDRLKKVLRKAERE